MNTHTNHTAEEPAELPRIVYVVRRAVRREGRGEFISAEVTRMGPAREYATPAEAHAAATRMGGPAGGFRVFQEFRNKSGMPCRGPRFES